MRPPATIYRFVVAEPRRIERLAGADEEPVTISHRTELHEHSATVGWGSGAGFDAAQAALALLADFLQDDELAVEHHLRFKFDLLSGDGGPMEIDGLKIIEWLEAK